MSKFFIIPKLTIHTLLHKMSVYLPYILANSLCMCVYYIFASIQQNDIMANVPYAAYIGMFMILGEVLLALILIPYLFSINKYLMKQRKTELGLYSVLGLEKKHIALMMLIETVILFIVSALIGVAAATVFSKLIFLFLCKVTHLAVTSEFTFSAFSLAITLGLFGVISLINLISNLRQVSMANPAELFAGAKQGEKEPKHLWLSTVIGLIVLGTGFFLALNSEINSAIFGDFFFAVALVAFGTNILFKSVSVSFLRACRSNKNYYYKSRNFVTVSGMLYRMRKNASGLANICIFCTMTIITLLCTLSVFLGEDEAIEFDYPYECSYRFSTEQMKPDDVVAAEIARLAAENGITTSEIVTYDYSRLYCYADENMWKITSPADSNETIRTMKLSEYNRTQGKNEALAPDEVLLFTAGKNKDYDKIDISGRSFTVKKELESISFFGKSTQNIQNDYLVVFDTDETIDGFTALQPADDYKMKCICFDINPELESTDEENALEQAAADIISERIGSMDGFISYEDLYSSRAQSYVLFGGLLFLGIFFGLVFIICMVLMMYYKQISEGYEDKRNFLILRQVGMSDREVKGTISRQILTVFFMPLVTSIIYTGIALNMICNLLATIKFFDVSLIIGCTGATVLFFAVVYGLSYLATAKAYYKIVG